MSVTGAAKTALDSAYAFRFVRLMQKSFSEWEAFKVGVIDERGNVLRRPKTEEEKSAYTPFHASVRSMKRMLSTVPGLAGVSSAMSAWSAIGSRFGLTEADQTMIIESLKDDYPLLEEMVAGDSGGSTENIATGTTTGAVTNKGPGVMGTVKRKRLKVNQSKL